MNKILIELINKNKCQPKIKNDGTNIISLFFTLSDKQEIINKKTGKIKKIYVKYNIFVKSFQIETDGHVIDDFMKIAFNKNEAIEKIIKLQEITNKVRDQMLDKKIMSSYNDETFNFIHYYRPHPICVRNGGMYIDNYKNVSQIDISKAYTSEYLKITHVPVFTTFNYPKKYNGEEIDDYNMYLIKIYEGCYIFQEKYTIIYGYNMKKMTLKYKIIQFLEYSYIKKIDSKKIIEDCYGDFDIHHLIGENDRKFIMNSSIGMMGKFKDKKEKSTIAFTEYEA